MTKYVWKARDERGNAVVKETVAASAAAAEAVLLAEGYTELALMENEVVEAVLHGFQPATVLGQEIKVGPTDRVKQYNKRATFLWALREGVGQSKSIVLVLLTLIAVFLYWRFYVSASLAGVALLAWLLFIIAVAMPAVLYGRLHKAGDWHRWDEVLGLVDKLERVNQIHFAKVPAFELARWRAKVLVAQGQLAEALAGFRLYENQPGCPSWLYKLFVAGLYNLAKEHDLAIEYTLKSIDEKPTPTAYRDLANNYLRYKRDPAKGRSALAEAHRQPIAEMSKPFDLRCQGILAFLEGDYPLARQHVEAAIALMEKTRNVPFRDGHISIARAYLCCVRAGQGQMAEARNSFGEARPYLLATDESELLRECERAIGEQKR